MAYKIAVGSSDGKNVDLKFGEVEAFLIYEVNGKEFQLLERRNVKPVAGDKTPAAEDSQKDVPAAAPDQDSSCPQGGCSGSQPGGCFGPQVEGCFGNQKGNSFDNQGEGCSGRGHGCSGPADVSGRVAIIEDCRCVLCKKIGFQAQKQFEKKAISVFDVECEIKEALDKIISYYDKIDHHISLANRS